MELGGGGGPPPPPSRRATPGASRTDSCDRRRRRPTDALAPPACRLHSAQILAALPAVCGRCRGLTGSLRPPDPGCLPAGAPYTCRAAARRGPLSRRRATCVGRPGPWVGTSASGSGGCRDPYDPCRPAERRGRPTIGRDGWGRSRVETAIRWWARRRAVIERVAFNGGASRPKPS